LKHPEIVDELEALGLAEDEASVYLRLLQVGPAKVSQLADHVDLSRSSLYRVLDDLVEEGFVSKSLDRPTVYTPEDPETIFELGSQDLRHQLDRLERTRDRLIDPLREIAGDQGIQTDGYHWKRIDGATRIYDMIAKRTREADDRIELLSNHDLCARTDLGAVEKAWQTAAERGRDGVELNLLVGFEDAENAIPEEVQEVGRCRSFDTDETLHFVVFDREELVVLIRPQDQLTAEDEEMAVWTNAPGILATHQSLVDALWTGAQA